MGAVGDLAGDEAVIGAIDGEGHSEVGKSAAEDGGDSGGLRVADGGDQDVFEAVGERAEDDFAAETSGGSQGGIDAATEVEVDDGFLSDGAGEGSSGSRGQRLQSERAFGRGFAFGVRGGEGEGIGAWSGQGDGRFAGDDAGFGIDFEAGGETADGEGCGGFERIRVVGEVVRRVGGGDLSVGKEEDIVGWRAGEGDGGWGVVNDELGLGGEGGRRGSGGDHVEAEEGGVRFDEFGDFQGFARKACVTGIGCKGAGWKCAAALCPDEGGEGAGDRSSDGGGGSGGKGEDSEGTIGDGEVRRRAGDRADDVADDDGVSGGVGHLSGGDDKGV